MNWRTMMLRIAVPLCLVTACASPHGGEYRQSAAPMAPAFNPAWDAPHTVGQPGHVAPEPAPRSPHKRYLPPTKEPGLWAGDEPKAVRQSVRILDVEIILGQPVAESDAAVTPIRLCAAHVQSVIDRDTHLMTMALELSGSGRRCFSAIALYECLFGKRGDKAALALAIEFALRLMHAGCDGSPGREAAERFARAWSASAYTTNPPTGTKQ